MYSAGKRCLWYFLWITKVFVIQQELQQTLLLGTLHTIQHSVQFGLL